MVKIGSSEENHAVLDYLSGVPGLLKNMFQLIHIKCVDWSTDVCYNFISCLRISIELLYCFYSFC